MNFDQWLAAKGFDPGAISDRQRASLLAAYEAETRPVVTIPVAQPVTPAAPAPASEARASDSSFTDTMAAIERENDRVQYIRTATIAAAERNVGDTEKIKQIRQLGEAAVSDKKTSTRDFDMSLLRLDRSIGPIVLAPQQQQVNEQVLEAAICRTYKLANYEKHFSDQVLQAAHTRFRRGIGLQELLMLAAERNSGYRGSSRDIEAVCRAAFRPSANDFYPSASGPSTITIPGILANTANKYLEAGFMYGEQSWRPISKIRTARDFKTMTTYRLTGTNKFERIMPGGEIKHGQLSELSYTNAVQSYGKMLGLDRRDIRNDDLGALTGASDELGRGAIDSLNEVFWTEYLDDAAFYPTDKSYSNYDDGATDSVLSLAGLDNANSIFRKQTKPDGTPMGIMPRILLVPVELEATALNLMNGQFTASAQSTATVTTENIWKGRYNVVSSVYLSSTAITGYSLTAWYLLADPNNVATIEVAFLDGVESPTVETSEFDFDRLGMSMRAYMDWGCNKQEYRGGVKLKGAG